jgi:DNA polymerase-3 subunit delta'
MHKQTARQIEAFTAALSGSFIFHGPRGVGKAHWARELSRRLNCQGDDPVKCVPCIQHAAGTWPDLIIVKPEDKPSILIEQVRALTQNLSLSPYGASSRRVVLIDDAHMLTIDAQNALLKSIEEPPPSTLFILATDQPEALVLTIRSRCATVYFPPVSEPEITNLLVNTLQLNAAQAKALAKVSDGAPGIAITLATTPKEAKKRQELAELAGAVLGRSQFERMLLSRTLVDQKTDITRFARLLHENLINSLRESSENAASISTKLNALERYRRASGSKVAPRVALDRLMLEL